MLMTVISARHNCKEFRECCASHRLYVRVLVIGLGSWAPRPPSLDRSCSGVEISRCSDFCGSPRRFLYISYHACISPSL